MASVSWSELHDRVATQVATVSGFSEGLAPLDPSGSPETLADRAFAVALEPSIERLTRQQDGEEALVDTVVVVHFLRLVVPDDQITSLRSGYDDAVSILRALMAQQAAAWRAGLRVSYLGGPTVARLGGGDYLRYALRFHVRHQLTF